MGAPADGIGVGQVFAGLRIDAVAGTGGMGTVFRAHHLALERTVAVKIIRPSLSADPEFEARFRREARLAASLDHPHVVPVLHGGTERGRLYLTMRFVEGTDLADHLRRRGPLDPHEVVQVLRQIGSALDAAHRHGLVHRDVKPANILVRRPQNPHDDPFHCYLTDFGISRRISDAQAAAITSTGIALGTVDYMAPEQLLGHPLDGRADQYALACVAYHLLTGAAPFHGSVGVATAAQHVNVPAPDARSRDPRIPAPLAQSLLRAMSKHPGERFVDCAALADAAAGTGTDAFGSLAAPDAPAARRAPTVPDQGERGADQPSRPGRRTLVIGGAAAALTAGAVVLATRVLRNDDATTPTPTEGAAAGPVVARAEGAPISLDAAPYRAYAHDGGVWTTCPDAGQIIRIDIADHGLRPITVDGGPSELAFAGGRAWVWNYSSAVTPVDLDSGRVGSMVRIEQTIGGLGAGARKVWFFVPSTGAVGSIDLSAGRVDGDMIQVGSRPRGLAVGDGVVHVLVAGRSQVVRIDEATRRVLDPAIDVPSEMAAIMADGSRVYVGGPTGLAVLGETAVTPDDLHWPQVGIAVAGGGAVWAYERTGRRLRKLSADLGAEAGAPVTGLPDDITDLALAGNTVWAADRNGKRVLPLRMT